MAVPRQGMQKAPGQAGLPSASRALPRALGPRQQGMGAGMSAAQPRPQMQRSMPSQGWSQGGGMARGGQGGPPMPRSMPGQGWGEGGQRPNQADPQQQQRMAMLRMLMTRLGQGQGGGWGPGGGGRMTQPGFQGGGEMTLPGFPSGGGGQNLGPPPMGGGEMSLPGFPSGGGQNLGVPPMGGGMVGIPPMGGGGDPRDKLARYFQSLGGGAGTGGQMGIGSGANGMYW